MSITSNILVVDDQDMNLDLCSRRLQRSGFTVSVASSGPQALDMVTEGRFDLVLLDHMMPDMSGLDVLRALRLRYTPHQLPIIMVTAVAEGVRIAEALDLGANDYVTKPIDFTVALARIRSLLSRNQIENALLRSEERYALAARGTHDGLWDWDLAANEIYYSPRWKTLLGLEEEELGNAPEVWFSRVHPVDRAALEHAIQLHLLNGSDALECECRVRHKDGSYRWMALHGVAVRSDDGRALRMVGSQSDVTDKATLDPLTRLPNRLLFSHRLSCAFERERSDRSWKFAVLFLDLDRFKLVNDGWGHIVGDCLLSEVANRLQTALVQDPAQTPCYADSVVARLGGDEFAVLLENIADLSAAEKVASGILHAMRPIFLLGEKELYCSLSIGIAVKQPGHQAENDLLRDADIAMYEAKAQGKGRWAVFEAAMQERQQYRLQMDSDLRRALQRSEFEVYYQPRVLLDSGDICGFEALVRWNHPTRGLMAPSEFVPAAEENGLIHDIGLWVLREACRQIKQWNVEYLCPQPLDVAVNLSPQQCHEPHLVEDVAAILKETGLPAACLNLELTESMLIEDVDEAKQILNDLKGLGVGLKIDDFGTGYSCLKYLSELPFDTLKIDRSFTFDLDREKHDSIEIVRTILLMAASLDMGVIAEGIETPEHVSRLKEMGCKFGQGFFFSAPVSASATEILLQGKRSAVDLVCSE